MTSARRLLAVILLLAAAHHPVMAGTRDADDQLNRPLNPTGQYRTGVPSPETFLNRPLGETFTPHDQIVAYMKTLAEVAADRCRWEPYGTTWEGRPLGYLVVSAPANIGKLEEIRGALADLADPAKTSRHDAVGLAERTPEVVWLSYNVHGEEASSSETALGVAYELAAGTGPDVMGLIDSLVVIIDPCLNPDGRDRYVSWFMQTRGREPDPNGSTREHDLPWPGGRYNHYLFDLNRDWAWLSQPETQARVKAFRKWHPQVHVDFHEMFPNSSYFFFPAAEPINTNLPAQVRWWGDRFGRGNAEAFDRHGWSYFTAESFDLLYPGYGDSWPTLQGATGMTYEQAGHGFAGTAFDRSDGTVLTLRERLRHHYETSMATLRTARTERVHRLVDYQAFFDEAVNGHSNAAAAYLIPPGPDTGRTRELVELLLAHGIEVERATGDLKVTEPRDYEGARVDRDFPAGTWVIPGRQPLGFLAHALLEPEASLPETLFYDVTAWSLPMAFGLEAEWSDKMPGGTLVPVTSVPPDTGRVVGGPARAGWLIPWDRNDAPRLLNRLLTSGLRARFATRSFELDGHLYDRGTILIPTGGNPDSTGAVIDREARRLGVTVHAASSGLTSTGIDFGSDRMLPVRTPHVAIVMGDAVEPTSFGALWFLLDRQYEIGCSVIPIERLASANLSNWNVLIFPDDDSGDGSSYDSEIDSTTVERIRRWVRAGGTFVGLKGGGAWATADRSGLTKLALKKEDEKKKNDGDKDADSTDDEKDKKFMTTDERERENRLKEIPGAILRVELDPGHPLAYGYDGEARVLKTSDLLFEPSESGRNVAWYPPLARVSGYISAENEERLAKTPFLVVEPLGSGRCVLYNDDPNFRVFWYGLNRLFLNSLFFAGGY